VGIINTAQAIREVAYFPHGTGKQENITLFYNFRSTRTTF